MFKSVTFWEQLAALAVAALLLPSTVFAQQPPGGTMTGKTNNQSVLLVVTSAAHLPNGRETGVWLEEFAVPYLLLKKAGYAVTVASPKGGAIPLDPHSLDDASKKQWPEIIELLNNSEQLKDVLAEDYAAIFLPGGHGTMMDFPEDAHLKRLLHDFDKAGKIIAAVCHGPAGLVGAKKADGTPLVAGKRITSFTDAEETAIKLETAVPFLLESKLRAEGANFVTGELWSPHVEVDGKLITGQNPASSEAVANAIIEQLN